MLAYTFPHVNMQYIYIYRHIHSYLYTLYIPSEQSYMMRRLLPYYISHARWRKAPVGLTKESSSSCGRGRVLVGFFHSPIWGGKESLGW